MCICFGMDDCSGGHVCVALCCNVPRDESSSIGMNFDCNVHWVPNCKNGALFTVESLKWSDVQTCAIVLKCVNDVQTYCIFFDIPFRVCIKKYVKVYVFSVFHVTSISICYT